MDLKVGGARSRVRRDTCAPVSLGTAGGSLRRLVLEHLRCLKPRLLPQMLSDLVHVSGDNTPLLCTFHIISSSSHGQLSFPHAQTVLL